jgi:hypothetical protein
VGDYFDRVNDDSFLKEPGVNRLRRDLLQSASGGATYEQCRF